MTILYDAKKRKPRLWVSVAFLCTPVLLIFLLITGTQNYVEQHKAAVKAKESEDIFERF